MHYWLLKSEPDTWGWQHQVTAGTSPWEGVHGGQAQKYLRQMRVNDEAYFYHTGKEKAIVGILRIARAAYPDPVDPKYAVVDVTPLTALPHPISLKTLKLLPLFETSPLARQPRLSVLPLTEAQWKEIQLLSQQLAKGGD